MTTYPAETLAEVERRWVRRFVDFEPLSTEALSALGVPEGVVLSIQQWRMRLEGDLAAAIDLGNRTLEAIPDDFADRTMLRWRCRTLSGLSANHADLGLYDEALLFNEQALELATRLGDDEARLGALNDRGVLYELEPDIAIPLYLEVIAGAKRLDYVRLEALATVNIGASPQSSLLTEGDLERTQRRLGDANPVLSWSLAAQRMDRLIERGALDEAAEIIGELRPIPLAEDVDGYITCTLACAALAREQGRADEAAALIREALPHASSYMRLRTLNNLSLALEAGGHLKEALDTERSLREEESEFHRAARTRQGLALEAHLRRQAAAERATDETGDHGTGSLVSRLMNLQAETDRLRELALRDALTGLYNRRFVVDVLAERVTAALGEGRPVGVAVIDLDRFKTINDDLGHEMGDEALRDVAGVLLRHLTADDLAIRHGGDEFIVVRIGNEGADGLAIALDGLSDEVARVVAERTGRAGIVSASVGVSAVTDDLDAAITAADRRMYRAKARWATAPRSRGIRPTTRSA